MTALQKQAEKMTKLSHKKFPVIGVGISVKVPVPLIDRGKVDQKNIIGIVKERTDDDLYKILTKHGVSDHSYTRSQIQPCKSSFLTIDDVKKIPNSVAKDLWNVPVSKVAKQNIAFAKKADYNVTQNVTVPQIANISKIEYQDWNLLYLIEIIDKNFYIRLNNFYYCIWWIEQIK